MKLARRVDKALVLITTFILAMFFTVFFMKNINNKTYAETEGVYKESDEYFVTFYDDGKKLTVKTKETTVKEALLRANISVEPTDIVEPSLDTVIDGTFYVNIYRARPVVLIDGKVTKYVMTASYDVKQIAKMAKMTIYDGDEVKMVPNTNFLEMGAASVYEIKRSGGRQVTEENEIMFDEELVKDYNLEPGTREVRQYGEVGIKTSVYNVLYNDGKEASRELVSETITKEPVTRIIAVGASEIERTPLTARRGRNIYTVHKEDGRIIERQETYYDLPMGLVMERAAMFCGVKGEYVVREDGVKVDMDGYVLVAANLDYYPRCSVVETSLGPGRVYDTGTFAESNPEQFDLATDWTNKNGR